MGELPLSTSQARLAKTWCLLALVLAVDPPNPRSRLHKGPLASLGSRLARLLGPGGWAAAAGLFWDLEKSR